MLEVNLIPHPMSNAGKVEAKALRIGNLVRYFHEESGFNDREIDIEDLAKISKPDSSLREYYEYVPLTEEWLVRLGFEYASFTVADEDGVYREKTMPNKDYFKHPDLSEKIIFYLPYFNFNYYIGSQTIKYVHQLQNLFHSLTGAELEVK